ncbi:hypothetical protein F511_45207 [Dorcoceras hygrometricum]|uniref:Uncharacterized protein n=1 Tax=Dorcoceras hygrometricum TaxID=472368 RepID=A0A2Z7A459_9LAMI|nr:hypothetical protein F511_45207 [Dorcoceras hygrometricum]
MRWPRLVARRSYWTAVEMCAPAAHSGRSRRVMVQSLHAGRPMITHGCALLDAQEMRAGRVSRPNRWPLLRLLRRTMVHGSAALVAVARDLLAAAAVRRCSDDVVTADLFSRV